jgi:hypothetical protein
MSSFDFYREAKNNYKHIVPSREDGLVLFYLYEKLQRGDFINGEFPESEILAAIEYVYVDVKGETVKRTEYERNNDIIIRLQEFFLWRNEEKKVYTFKSYGTEFCKNIKVQLEKFYSPTEIKSIFDSLIYELKTSKKNESDFSGWMKLHFDLRSPELARQIEILDQQVSDAVKNFRSQIVANEKDIHHVISDVLASLKIIKINSDEFKNAFHGTYEIEESLLNFQENVLLTDESMVKIRRVSDFIRRIRINLELVSRRIDQIQPRIREFIHDFNQRDFDRKTELFLKHLIRTSLQTKLTKDAAGKIIKENTPVFSIVIKRDIGLSKPVEMPVRKINAEKRERSLIELKKKQFISKQVLFWVNEVQNHFIKENKLYFTGLLYRILSTEEQYSLTIAVKVSNKITLKYGKHPSFAVKIDKEIIKDESHKNIAAWKMYIQKKKTTVIPS